ncbi:hypothetical protein HDU93_008999 [Gonapodya sp. JEL0774]|nr:hypothetical protein HDU93_008999 [Gonapodya sp. JEL0774]
MDRPERSSRDAFVTINLSDENGDLVPVSIDITRGDLIVAAVRRVVLENDLPDNLIESLVETVAGLVRDLGERDGVSDGSDFSDGDQTVDINVAVKDLADLYMKYTAAYNTTVKEVRLKMDIGGLVTFPAVTVTRLLCKPLFPKAYHALSSSPLPTLFDRLLLHERRLAERVDELWRHRAFALADLQRRHAEEVEAAQQKVPGHNVLGMTQVLGKHVEEMELLNSTYTSALESTYEEQRRDFRTFVELLYERHKAALRRYQEQVDQRESAAIDSGLPDSSVIPVKLPDGKKIFEEVYTTCYKPAKRSLGTGSETAGGFPEISGGERRRSSSELGPSAGTLGISDGTSSVDSRNGKEKSESQVRASSYHDPSLNQIPSSNICPLLQKLTTVVAALSPSQSLASLKPSISQPDPELSRMAQDLTDMGFDKELSHAALELTNKDLDLAARAQTASSLYGTRLNGVLLLVTKKEWERWTVRAGRRRGGWRPHAFRDNCLRSTEFHFDDLSKQLENITAEMENRKEDKGGRTEEGDYFITRHSNLPMIQVVFHLIIEEGSLRNELTTRSPVISGYRHLLRTAYRHDVHQLTIPLLFLPDASVSSNSDQPSQPGTADIQALLRRAEVVLKATKGFMIEAGRQGRHASGTGGVDKESRTLQFLLPGGNGTGGVTFAEGAFALIRDKVAEIFRTT